MTKRTSTVSSPSKQQQQQQHTEESLPLWLSPSNDAKLVPILTGDKDATTNNKHRRLLPEETNNRIRTVDYTGVDDDDDDEEYKELGAVKFSMKSNHSKKNSPSSISSSFSSSVKMNQEFKPIRMTVTDTGGGSDDLSVQQQQRPPLPFTTSWSTLATLNTNYSGIRLTKLPERWVDFFCIVGLDREQQQEERSIENGEKEGNARTENGSERKKEKTAMVGAEKELLPLPSKQQQQQQQQQRNCLSETMMLYQPVVLDTYPTHRPDMEFPDQIATFCFPTGCHPMKVKKKKTDGCIVIKQNIPDPTLCTIVLTTGTGRRLYGTTLMVYEEWDMGSVTTSNTSDNEMVQSPTTPTTTAGIITERPSKRIKQNIKAGNSGLSSSFSSAPTTAAMDQSTGNVSSSSSSSYTYFVPKCYVLISHYPFFHAQSTILKELLYTVQSGASPVPLERYIAHIVEDIPLPSPPGRTKVEWNSWTTRTIDGGHGGGGHGGDDNNSDLTVPSTIATLYRPPPNQLPLLNVSSYEPLLRTLSLSNVLVLWATLLREGRVVLCCHSRETVGLVTPIAQALLSLLFPFEWQGMYIPLLPTGHDDDGGDGSTTSDDIGRPNSNNHKRNMDILEAPVPYLVGLCLPTTNGKKQYHRPPNGVVWCDLDEDVVHLGWKDDGTVQDGVPSLPEAASMRLKAELEEVADPLFLPPTCGIKGRMTVGGDTSQYLDNSARDPPYAPMTRLFHDDNPRPTPRAYILTQSSKVPPRGCVLKYEDFNLNDGTTKADASHKNGKKYDHRGGLGSFFFPTDTTRQEENHDPKVTMTVLDVGEDANRKMDTDTDSSTASSFLLTLKRQGRSIQAHTDRFMSVLGQNFATPSQYANRGDGYMENDILQQQDEIAAKFFDTNDALAGTVRQCFVRFFVSVLSGYKSYVDEEEQRLDVYKFIRSLRLSQRNQDFVRELVQTQMFELFLQDVDSNQRRYFDETIIRQTQRNNKTMTVLKSSNQDNNNNNNISKGQSPTPFLDSTKWELRNVITPPPPSSGGIRKGQVFLIDRNFPDRLDHTECVTSSSLNDGGGYCDVTDGLTSWGGSFCSVFLSCGY